ncbi:MAG TPA: DUF4340 domain-containing protein, partial [Gammaproteobacteria bacterium]|nr:DUF4340 domain-containing protein [Gammaproteobacteria bacterium]
MSMRTVAILAGVLVVLLALVIFGQRTSTPVGTGSALVPDLEAALGDLERVTVVKANGETVATLEKRPDNWVVADKHGYVANAAKLRQALTALAEARIVEQKTANPELYGRLGVEDVTGATAAGLSVALTASGRTLPTIILGNAEGSRYRYARRAGEAQSYLIDRNPDVPRAAAQWVDTVIVDVRGDRVREVTITHPDGEVVRISKASAELANFEVADVPNGRELSYPGVANVIGNALRELALEDVEPAAAPAGQPTIVEYRTFDGLVVRVTGIERDDEHWITLEASVDSAQAGAATPAAPAEGAAAEGAAAPATPAAPASDPNAEAARINAKASGWRYKIAGYQYDQMTRRM